MLIFFFFSSVHSLANYSFSTSCLFQSWLIYCQIRQLKKYFPSVANCLFFSSSPQLHVTCLLIISLEPPMGQNIWLKRHVSKWFYHYYFVFALFPRVTFCSFYKPDQFARSVNPPVEALKRPILNSTDICVCMCVCVYVSGKAMYFFD